LAGGAMTIEAYPLNWPAGWRRNQDPEYSKFIPGSPFSEAQSVTRELELMGADSIIISSNMQYRQDGIPYARQSVSDTGVAVYFKLNGKQQCIPCDRWVKLEENLRAIAKTIEALRGIERWGAKEMVDAAFSGFKALPASTQSVEVPMPTWFEVLRVSEHASKDDIKAAYRREAHLHHPDKGGEIETFKRISQAYDEGMGV